jgi:ParB family chromosome partitioning protein
VVVDGRQRVKAARIATEQEEKAGGMPILVPCMMRRGNPERLFGVAVSANEMRQDDTPLGRANKVLRLLEMGHTEDECATHFGVTTQTIAGWLKLAELDNEVQHAVDVGDISATAAVQLHGLESKEQRTTLKKLVSSGGAKRPTVNKARSAGKKAKQKPDQAYRIRTRKEILEAVPEKRRDDVKRFLSGGMANRLATIIEAIGRNCGSGDEVVSVRKELNNDPAFIALKAMIDG